MSIIILVTVLVAVAAILPVVISISSINSNRELINCYKRFLEKNKDISDELRKSIELHERFHKEQIKDFWFIIFCFVILSIVLFFILNKIF